MFEELVQSFNDCSLLFMCLARIEPTVSIGVVVHANVSILSYSLDAAIGSRVGPKMEEIFPLVSGWVSFEDVSKLHSVSSSSANTLAAQVDEEILRAYEIADPGFSNVSKNVTCCQDFIVVISP